MKQFNHKLLLLCFCSFVSFSAMSNQSLEIKTKQQEAFENSKVVLKKMGLYLLDGEIKIVPARMILANNQGKNNAYVANINKSLKMHLEQQKNGYVNEPAPRAKELLELEKASYYQYKKYENEFSPTSTHLRHNISELKMAYTFVGVPESVITNNIGIAPYGAYKQTKYGDGGDGWDGAIQFFENKNIGTCEFREHNLKLAHSGLELIKEVVSYQVNNKPTVILVTGDETTGYLYRISWYDNLFDRDLYCATEKFNKNTTNKIIELANNIELAQ